MCAYVLPLLHKTDLTKLDNRVLLLKRILNGLVSVQPYLPLPYVIFRDPRQVRTNFNFVSFKSHLNITIVWGNWVPLWGGNIMLASWCILNVHKHCPDWTPILTYCCLIAAGCSDTGQLALLMKNQPPWHVVSCLKTECIVSDRPLLFSVT